jgi:hypothetical protein
MSERWRGEQGIALVIAVMSMMLMAALGAALVLTTTTEAGISASYVAGVEAFYAADAAVERTLADLPDVADWSSLVGVRVEAPADVVALGGPSAPRIRVVLTVSAAPVEGALVIRAQADGPRGVERTVEATVVRTGEAGPAAVRLLSWREVN